MLLVAQSSRQEVLVTAVESETKSSCGETSAVMSAVKHARIPEVLTGNWWQFRR